MAERPCAGIASALAAITSSKAKKLTCRLVLASSEHSVSSMARSENPAHRANFLLAVASRWRMV